MKKQWWLFTKFSVLGELKRNRVKKTVHITLHFIYLRLLFPIKEERQNNL